MGATDAITLQRILTTAAGWHASDLHFVVGNQPTLRIDGKLKILEDEQIITPEVIESIAKTVLTEAQRQQLATQKEITTAFSLNPQARFKVTAVYQRGSLAISLHVISSTVPRLSDLSAPPAVTTLTTITKGLVLVTGPYGSGKTTTLTAMVNEINATRAATIVSIESPIEHLFVNVKSLIEQREVGRDALSYEQAIVAANREDVDVIVVSEASSPSVLAACLDAAEASRLVLTTMTTNSVMGTIEKVLNSFPANEAGKIRTQFANTLAGIVSQRLLPRIGGGQVVVSEVLMPTAPVRAVIRDGALFQLGNVLQTSREGGHVSLDRSLMDLVQEGTITPEDAMINAQEPNLFRPVK
jgi:twitching motility protein PilT